MNMYGLGLGRGIVHRLQVSSSALEGDKDDQEI